MTNVLHIACDEAGHTGPDLLHRDQRYFAFCSVAVTDDEAANIISRLRAKFPVQMPELKASKLLASDRGRSLVVELLGSIEGRYIVSAYDKLLALCGWLFEYIYEPVYRDNPKLLYEKDLHRFVAMYTWLWMTDGTSEARRAIEQFQQYMRSRDPADAPFLFDHPRPPLSDAGSEHPFECVLRFAYGYRDIIIADNAKLNTVLPDKGRWTLDLSASAMWSHLNFWGQQQRPLSVQCDASKPIEAIVANFTGDDNDPGIRRARANFRRESLGWKLAAPVSFVDSRAHPAVQLADVVAGATVTYFTTGFAEGASVIAECIARHAHQHSILPDMDRIDPTTRSAAVNALILYDLAKRAERRGDPHENLEIMYRLAEVGWSRGAFDTSKK